MIGWRRKVRGTLIYVDRLENGERARTAVRDLVIYPGWVHVMAAGPNEGDGWVPADKVFEILEEATTPPTEV